MPNSALFFFNRNFRAQLLANAQEKNKVVILFPLIFFLFYFLLLNYLIFKETSEEICFLFGNGCVSKYVRMVVIQKSSTEANNGAVVATDGDGVGNFVPARKVEAAKKTKEEPEVIVISSDDESEEKPAAKGKKEREKSARKNAKAFSSVLSARSKVVPFFLHFLECGLGLGVEVLFFWSNNLLTSGCLWTSKGFVGEH